MLCRLGEGGREGGDSEGIALPLVNDIFSWGSEHGREQQAAKTSYSETPLTAEKTSLIEV